MRYASIRNLDVSNGDGIGVALFVQGCNRHCKNCFNEEYWPFDYGQEYDDAAMQKFIDLGKSPNVTGYSLLGGEPMDQLMDDMLLMTRAREADCKSLLAEYHLRASDLDVLIFTDGQFLECYRTNPSDQYKEFCRKLLMEWYYEDDPLCDPSYVFAELTPKGVFLTDTIEDDDYVVRWRAK